MSRARSRWPAPPPLFDRASAAEQLVARTVAERLARMTIEQKIAQMIQAEIATVTPADAGQYGLGAVLNGGGSFPGGNKHASVDDWLALADAYYEAAVASASDRSVPPLWGTDAVHGHSNVYRATIFPHNIGLGAAGDADLIEEIARATAREVAATGIDWTFAPTLAVVRDDRWGRTYEAYAEHPDLVAEYAGRMIKGLQGGAGEDDFLGPGRVLATSKHFVGEGQTTGGRDQGDADCSEATLRDMHAAGHRAALAAGAQTVMAAYNSWLGNKIHGSTYLLTEVLKGALGFDGFVVSDWNGYQQVADDHAEATARTVNAGVDLLMAGEDWPRAYHDLLGRVRAGTVPVRRIDDAVTRILRVKTRARKFTQGPPSKRLGTGDAAVVGNQAHRDIARRAVRQSLVLLKNDTVLPLPRTASVLVAGDAAHNISKQCGGWTLTWQGTGNDNADFPHGTSIYEGIAQAVADSGSVMLRPDGNCGDADPDVAIVVFGEDPYAEGDGDRTHLSYSAGNTEPLAILQRLQARGVRTVSVFLAGRPMWVNPELNASDAFVAAWLPGTEGGGIADVIFRGVDGNIAHDFEGRLTVSWPSHALQTPLNVGDVDYAPLFPYGFGLRYGDTPLPPRRLDEADVARELPAPAPPRTNPTYPR